ncbi:hypothetical protein PF010_g24014 [Phytophthora fragariae]|uniref:RxLR effector protein n=1 Tax=Phytophthora fragariae TaxID=53985 RepID=A0A6G0K4R8_9STRA|nr:hypothetical protein PF010_g24014 [Phytophthora fragariae]
MFSSSKIAALCLAAVALSSGAHAEQEAAQTFGLLAAGLNGGMGLYGAGGVSATPTVALESEALPELALEQVPEQLLESVLEETRA